MFSTLLYNLFFILVSPVVSGFFVLLSSLQAQMLQKVRWMRKTRPAMVSHQWRLSAWGWWHSSSPLPCSGNPLHPAHKDNVHFSFKKNLINFFSLIKKFIPEFSKCRKSKNFDLDLDLRILIWTWQSRIQICILSLRSDLRKDIFFFYFLFILFIRFARKLLRDMEDSAAITVVTGFLHVHNRIDMTGQSTKFLAV